MPFSFLPALIADDVTQLTPELLTQRGIRLLMLDFDNTLVPYTTDTPQDRIVRWIAAMQDSPITLCVVSNSKKDRVVRFCETYGIPCITHARKPFSKGIRMCMERFAVPAGACALVGDQIYTDVLGANGCGVQAILIRAIHNHNIWLKLRQAAQTPFIFAARKRRLDR